MPLAKNLPRSATLAASRAMWKAVLLLLIAGCAGAPSVPQGTSALGQGFLAQGQLAVAGKEQAFSARFRWRQAGERYDIALWGPLGQNRTRLLGDGEHLQIIGPKGVPLAAGPPEAVMQAQLGWRLPLAVLPHWIQGRPAPFGGIWNRQRDAEGRLTAFQQLGWTVHCNRFRDAPLGMLPSRVTVRRPGYQVRVAISRMSLLAQP